MATIRKLASGRWQAQVARKGNRKSKSFDKRIEARDWAAREEHLISTGEYANSPQKKTFGDLLQRYAREVCPQHRGARWEILRIDSICRHDVATTSLEDLTPDALAQWRDQRLSEVQGSSVKREMQIISGALNVARKEWGWVKQNPITDVRKPAAAAARDRRITQDEIDRVITAAGSNYRKTISRVGLAFLFGIETAMRAGEICGLHANDINKDSRVAFLPLTKNGTSRKVPLSSRAIEVLDMLPPTGGQLFGMTAANLSSTFRDIRDKAEIKDLRFHDTRHEAITRLAKKLDVLSLARMVGHKDIRMLQIYYNETAEELARRLD